MKQEEMIGPWALRSMKEQGQIAKLDRRLRRQKYHKNPPVVIESEMKQQGWEWTDESRNFAVWPNCSCGFKAVLLKRVGWGGPTYKIVCTRIRCTCEAGPNKDKNAVLNAWKMMNVLNRV